MEQKENVSKKYAWDVRISIFKNSIILKQIAIAIGIPFGFVSVFLLISSNEDNRIYALYALGLIAALFFLTYLLILVLWGGKYDVGFMMDDNGILCYTQMPQAKKNRIINRLTMITGLLSGKPTVAGAGMLAETRQSVFLHWNRIQKVKYHPGKQVIMLRGGFTENVAVFCTKENYHEIEAVIYSKIPVRL